MDSQQTLSFEIKKIKESSSFQTEDFIAIEEPLEIRLKCGDFDQSISITMRSPGNDIELALGFLFNEGIIKTIADIYSLKHCGSLFKDGTSNIVKVQLKEHLRPDLKRLDRSFLSSAACGVCGKKSLEALSINLLYKDQILNSSLKLKKSLIYSLPKILRAKQKSFELSGGLHGNGLFDEAGKLICIREDIGRHNAVDKIVGERFFKGKLPLNNHILLLSGRAGFELIQKAAAAGISIVAAVGAPSSLAVEYARQNGITLIGFLRDEKFNIYSHSYRILDE